MGFFQDLKEDLSIAVDELASEGKSAEGAKEGDDAMTDEEIARQLEAMTQASGEMVADAGQNEAGESHQEAVATEATAEQEDASDVMPSKDLADALQAAGVVSQENGADAISPDGKAAPVFGEQMELNLVQNQDPIEAAASELENIASIVNKEKAPDEGNTEEKQVTAPEETLAGAAEESAADQAEPSDETSVVTEENLGTQAVDENAVITKCMTVKGDILSRGSVEIIGSVEGNVRALGKLNVSGVLKGDASAAEVFADAAQISGQIQADGTAKIGKNSVIIGNIYATSAVIAGAVKGDIDVHGPVILDSSAIVMGNIRSKSVQINNGAAIEGLCSQCYADSTPSSFFERFSK